MIIIVEGIFTKWQHEECNSGIISLLGDYFGNQEIKLYGTNELIENLRLMGLDEKVVSFPIAIPEKAVLDSEINIKYYALLLFRILKTNKIKNDDKLIFLSANKSIMLAALLVTRIFHRLPTYFICHGFLEQLLYVEDELNKNYSIKKVFERLGRADWVQLIVFNPFARKILKDRLDRRIVRKMHFLHHPMLGEPVAAQPHDKIIIGVYGACVKGAAKYFILNMHRALKREDYLIKVLESGGINLGGSSTSIPSLSNTKIIRFSDGYLREERLREMREMDFILLPYTQNQYRVSMSGILADAIKYEIPIIAYDSPIISWYGRWKIGIIGQDTNDLINKVNILLENPDQYRDFYVSNIKRMKKSIKRHNQKLLKEIFGE